MLVIIVLIIGIIGIAIVIIHSLHCHQRWWRQRTRDITPAAWRHFAFPASVPRQAVLRETVLPRTRPRCQPWKRARLTRPVYLFLLVRISKIFGYLSCTRVINAVQLKWPDLICMPRVIINSAVLFYDSGCLWLFACQGKCPNQNSWLNFKIEMCFKVKMMSDPIILLSAAAEAGVDTADSQTGACLTLISHLFISLSIFVIVNPNRTLFCGVANLHQQSHRSTKDLETPSQSSPSYVSIAWTIILRDVSHIQVIWAAADPAHSRILL